MEMGSDSVPQNASGPRCRDQRKEGRPAYRSRKRKQLQGREVLSEMVKGGGAPVPLRNPFPGVHQAVGGKKERNGLGSLNPIVEGFHLGFRKQVVFMDDCDVFNAGRRDAWDPLADEPPHARRMVGRNTPGINDQSRHGLRPDKLEKLTGPVPKLLARRLSLPAKSYGVEFRINRHRIQTGAFAD